MCGIWGFIAKEGKKVNIKKLKILGTYNVQRGTDSCGYYYNGNIKKGINDQKIWTDFIEQEDIIPGELNNGIFMGHTRKSTVGAHNADNAHPHTVFDYTQTHNGVIRNVFDLCKKYDIPYSVGEVDSIVLAKIIQKHGFGVLNDYIGFAALSMVFAGDPGSLYLYHGASCESHTDDKMYEERPLFILHQPEGIYYSSMKNSLKFISENKTKPEILPHNVVYQFRNGVMTDFRFNVERSENNKPYVPPAKVYNQAPVNNTYHQPQLPLKTNDDKIVEDKHYNIGFSESFPIGMKEVYHRWGRFQKSFGILLHGIYKINREDKIIVGNDKSHSQVETYYFVRGVMLRNKEAYTSWHKEYSDFNDNMSFAFYISYYSKYPVCNLPHEGRDVVEGTRYKWYYNGKYASNGYCPKFSDRRYNLKNGMLKEVKSWNEKDVVPILKIRVDTIHVSLDSPLTELIFEIFDQSYKKITEDRIKDIPESFLLFVDAYCKTFYKTANPDPLLIENDTTTILKDMQKAGVNFNEYLIALKDNYLTTENVRSIVRKFTPNDYANFESKQNRYHYIDFTVVDTVGIEDIEPIDIEPTENDSCDLPQTTTYNPEIDNMLDKLAKDTKQEHEDSKEYLADLIIIGKELREIAEKLQSIDSIDIVQETALVSFTAVEKIENQLRTISKTPEYTDIANLID